MAAGRSGARVILAEQDRDLGGSLLSRPVGSDSDAWLESVTGELRAMENVRILARSTVFGAYDNEVYGIVERVWDHRPAPPDHQPRQRYWQVRAKQAVLATGAIERPFVFGGNDRPGVMLASAARTYLNRYAVLPGQRVLVATNNDSAYAVARDLARAGAHVTVADCRQDIPDSLRAPAAEAGVDILPGHAVVAASGSPAVSGATITAVDSTGQATGFERNVYCDLIAASAGWAPVVHLWSQRQQKPVYDAAKGCFLPVADALATMRCAGAVMACGPLGTAAAQGFAAGKAAAAEAGTTRSSCTSLASLDDPYADDWARDLHSIWAVTGANGRPAAKAFIDLQHDVMASDVDLAHREGYVSVEHLKRYTTAGMATDQGKLSNVNALARMADLRGCTVAEVGTTTFRPPFTPISFGAIVGHEHGLHFSPTRLTPMHDWHVAQGAVLMDAGHWKRPRFYPEGDEGLAEAYKREAAHVRSHVGMVDVSTLGKIAVQGPDAAEFLNRVYVNGWKALAVGRLRYGVMLREDGFVMDDGATARLGEHDYFMSTTTGNAAKVLAVAEHLLQTAWTDLKVHVTSVSDQWAAIAVAGPKSRDLLRAVVSGADFSREAMPNNHLTDAEIAEVPVRVHRMSYSGELAYEIYIPAGYGHRVWEALIEAGGPFKLKVYGTEAMGTLRIEKGHVAGPELEGRTTMKDLGLEGLASSKKPFVGSILRHRPVLADPARPSLVGLEVMGDRGALPGSLLFDADGPTTGHGEGWVSSTTYSPALGKNIALALLRRGPERIGETIRVVDFVSDTTLTAEVVSPHFFDPKGERQNA
ncbi:MAG: sarcosine oxidase subunit alpha family protein [Alphaproteobacteria bacterium]|nr:sarcosine oxidase subunit alpha family protein [Alphaproteobacteria bacterium]